MSEPKAELQVCFLALDDADPIAIRQAFPASSEIAFQLAAAPADDLDSRRRTITHAVLRLSLARWIGIEAALRPFTSGYAGKPQLAHTPSSGLVDFSLSHTGAVALIGLARHCCIGVDIERPRSVSMSRDRRQQIISVAEAIGGSSILETLEGDTALLAAWVRLEAASKATGEGMGRLLTRYRIVGSKADFAEVSQSIAARETLHVRDLQVPPPYFGALATTIAAKHVAVQIFDTSARGIKALLEQSDQRGLAPFG